MTIAASSSMNWVVAHVNQAVADESSKRGSSTTLAGAVGQAALFVRLPIPDLQSQSANAFSDPLAPLLLCDPFFKGIAITAGQRNDGQIALKNHPSFARDPTNVTDVTSKQDAGDGGRTSNPVNPLHKPTVDPHGNVRRKVEVPVSPGLRQKQADRAERR